MSDDLLAQLLQGAPDPGEPPRRAPRPSRRRNPKPIDYDAFALSFAEWCEVVFWAGAWVVDMIFTAFFLNSFFAVALPIGFCVHIVISFVQQHLWRHGWREHWIPVFILGGFNIASSIIGLWSAAAGKWADRPFAILDIQTVQVPASQWLFYGSMVLAVGIALLPERFLSKYIARLLSR